MLLSSVKVLSDSKTAYPAVVTTFMIPKYNYLLYFSLTSSKHVDSIEHSIIAIF